MRLGISIIPLFLFFSLQVDAQFAPVPVTGFTQDVIAEGGPNSSANTTMELDAIGSNKVMYSQAFAAFAGITNGLPNGGLLTSGADNYQLGNYAGNNALFVKRNESFDLNLTTPASYGKLRVVCFSTEGPSTINLAVTFTDNSTTNYINNYILPDWFFGASNIITQGFGRVSRTVAGPWPPDGLPGNPKIYYVEITLNCADIAKQVSKITCTNVSTSGNAPFPNAVMLGLSGIPYTRNIVDIITPANCAQSNGSISLTVTGSNGPFTYAWNLTPPQTGPTATGLGPGSQSCTITDAAGCIFTYTGIVPQTINATMAITPNPANICLGASVLLTANVTGTSFQTYNWTPGSFTTQSINVSPSTTTTYTVNGSDGVCSASAQVTVTVNPLTTFFTANNASICSGSTASLQIIGSIPGYTYDWYDAATGGNLVGSGNPFITPALTATTTYYVEALSAIGCRTLRTAVAVTVNALPAAPAANNVTVCSGTNATLTVSNPQPGQTYNWFTTATGGTAQGTGTSFVVSNVTGPLTYYVEALATGGCSSTTRTPVTISVYQQLPTPVVTLSNVTVGSLTFSWTAIPGATAYEITTNGGLNYQSPSSGATGTTHTISGLAGNTTITLQVRALRTQACETSLLSAPVSGTTLSTKEVFVPNVFTPNNDGKNDRLSVFGNYVASMQFRIFNQWGQLIFYADNISNGWDGTYQGQQQPVGVYAYTLKVVLTDATIVNKKGSINLIR